MLTVGPEHEVQLGSHGTQTSAEDPVPPTHVNPGSIVLQSAAQPSVPSVLPSSQRSTSVRRPSPHTALHTSSVLIEPPLQTNPTCPRYAPKGIPPTWQERQAQCLSVPTGCGRPPLRRGCVRISWCGSGVRGYAVSDAHLDLAQRAAAVAGDRVVVVALLRGDPIHAAAIATERCACVHAADARALGAGRRARPSKLNACATQPTDPAREGHHIMR